MLGCSCNNQRVPTAPAPPGRLARPSPLPAPAALAHVTTAKAVVCATCTGSTVSVLAANQAEGLYMPCPASRRSSRRSLSQATAAV